jgi:integrase
VPARRRRRARCAGRPPRPTRRSRPGNREPAAPRRTTRSSPHRRAEPPRPKATTAPRSPLRSTPQQREYVPRRGNRRRARGTVLMIGAQAVRLLDAVRAQGHNGRHLVTFFRLLYYAALRPAEAPTLDKGDLTIPVESWGELYLPRSGPRRVLLGETAESGATGGAQASSA